MSTFLNLDENNVSNSNDSVLNENIFNFTKSPSPGPGLRSPLTILQNIPSDSNISNEVSTSETQDTQEVIPYNNETSDNNIIFI